MRDDFLAVRVDLRALLSTAAVAVLVGCAPPLNLRTASTQDVVVAQPTDTLGAIPEPATVQVRYFSFSPVVSVVAWSPAEAGYGLRAWIRRDGSLIRDHRIYVSTYYEPAVRAYPHAAVPPRKLLMTGIAHDVYACYFGDSCSPFESYGARIPDDLLRASTDSIAVTFYGRRGGPGLTVTVRRELIEAYLEKVDSVSVELRRSS